MTEETKLPDEWTQIPIHDLIDKGYRPRVKKVKGTQYLSLKKGNSERGLGHYTPTKWELLMELFPKLKVPTKTTDDNANSEESESVETLFSTKIGKPKTLKKTFTPTLETLNWYEWLKGHGYEGQFEDFINELVLTYFMEHGLFRPVMIIREE